MNKRLSEINSALKSPTSSPMKNQESSEKLKTQLSQLIANLNNIQGKVEKEEVDGLKESIDKMQRRMIKMDEFAKEREDMQAYLNEVLETTRSDF